MTKEKEIIEANTPEFLALLNQVEDADRYLPYEQEDGFHRHPITGRILHSPTFGADPAAVVNFSIEPVYSKAKTYQNGGTPVYDDVEMISIYVPGFEKTLTVHDRVSAFHKWRFPNEYKAFKEKRTQTIEGTPLAILPGMSPATIKNLDGFGIQTVEQLASVADSAVTQIPGSYGLREKARKIVEQQNSKAANSEQQKQIDAQNAQIAALQTQLEQLLKLKAPVEAESSAEDVGEEPVRKPKMRFGKPIKE